VLAGAVVAQHARTFTPLAQSRGRGAVVWLMDAALQITLVKTDLFEHPGDRLRVDVFAAVRAAGYGKLDPRQSEAVCRAARDEWDGLKGLGRGTKISDRLRITERGDEAAFAVHGSDVASVARLDDGAAPDFDKRRGLWDVLILMLCLQLR
jgi:hypothetical protein